MKSENKLVLVLPSYNEEEVLSETIKRLTVVIDDLIANEKISKDSYMLFVDDGSADKTWDIIEEYSTQNKLVKGLKLSRNQSHQNALIAGMEYVTDKCDLMVSLDVDLQDDVNCITKMVDDYHNGSEIVYGVRSSRKKDSFFKRTTAEGFYKVMKLMGVNIIFNHADYRLMSRKALQFFYNFPERNLFIRGMVPLVGLKSSIVEYERMERFAGESKYPLLKMLSFAWDGITSFSVTPLRIISLIGFMIFSFSFIISMWVLYTVIFTSDAVHGWASTTLPIYLLGGIQLLAIGVIGEYMGKMYKETKNRPRYFIDKVISDDEDNK